MASLEDLDNRVRQVEMTVLRVETIVLSLSDIIKATDRAIRGNGGAGLLTRVDRLEQSRTWLTWAVRIALGVVITATVGAMLLLPTLLKTP